MNLRRVHPQKIKMTTLQDLGLSTGLHQRTRYSSQLKLHTLKPWHYQKHKLPQDGRFINQPLNIVDPVPAVASKVNTVTTPSVQQSVMPVSFASTTQVWMDVPVPPTVNSSCTPVSTTRVPLSQIPSMASTANTIHSSQLQDQNADPCRKCGKNSHPMVRCHKRVMCNKFKSKYHNT